MPGVAEDLGSASLRRRLQQFPHPDPLTRTRPTQNPGSILGVKPAAHPVICRHQLATRWSWNWPPPGTKTDVVTW